MSPMQLKNSSIEGFLLHQKQKRLKLEHEEKNYFKF